MWFFLKNWGPEDVSYCDQFWNVSGVEAARKRRLCSLEIERRPPEASRAEQPIVTANSLLEGEADIRSSPAAASLTSFLLKPVLS